MGLYQHIEETCGVTVDNGVQVTDLLQLIYEQRGRCRLSEVDRRSERSAEELHAMLLTAVPTVTKEGGEPFTVEDMRALMGYVAQYHDDVAEEVEMDCWQARQARKSNDPERREMYYQPLAREHLR
jgi:hypothetical protein